MKPIATVIDTMVNRFLCWELPKDFAPDGGISFDGRKDDELNKNKTWPVGTNLFTAEQAKQMFTAVMPTDNGFLSLEKQYAERLGRMAQLCDTVIPYLQKAMAGVNDSDIPAEVSAGITEIMDYVDAVRP